MLRDNGHGLNGRPEHHNGNDNTHKPYSTEHRNGYHNPHRKVFDNDDQFQPNSEDDEVDLNTLRLFS